MDISSSLTEKCIKQLDSVAEVKLKVNDLCWLPCLQTFQNTKAELEKFIQLLDTNITLYKFQIKQRLCNIKREIMSEDCLSENQSHKCNLQELSVQIKVLLTALELSGKTPLFITVDAIFYYYSYVKETSGFNSCLNYAQIDLLIKQLHFIISKVQSTNDKCNNIEIEVWILGNRKVSEEIF